ncbi:MAG: hypothetical protein A2787_00220 [Omnitrophica WOR_2 bacterium RIFCSPHIGHO2_01_FULL_48_9]|nr:MAG: hypothetical protein A2787_00220 [Omnitrophica WOR_2 bacterium RIFCSPHIGHO2_01_FULL_48_9]
MHDTLQTKLLRAAYKIFPFDLRGDFRPVKTTRSSFISCLICASNRADELDMLLTDLTEQTLMRTDFEVVLLNDGQGEAIRRVVEKYQSILPIVYHENAMPDRVIGHLRNRTLELSCGEYVLFLDDDTRLQQCDFLEKTKKMFSDKKADAILPKANALYGIVKWRYDYLNAYSYSTRCCLYRRAVLEKVGGFINDIKSYEDIDLSIRLTIAGIRTIKTAELQYFHPPLYFDSMRKPYSVGQAILQMRRRYSLGVWLLIYLNSLRFLPFGLIPNQQCQQWFKISLGILLSVFKREQYYY